MSKNQLFELIFIHKDHFVNSYNDFWWCI